MTPFAALLETLNLKLETVFFRLAAAVDQPTLGQAPRLIHALLFTILPFAIFGMAPTPQDQPKVRQADIEVFVRRGCPHCEEAKKFLEQLRSKRPEITIFVRDVGEDPKALARLRALAAKFDVKRLGVPTFYVGGELVVGYSSPETTGARLEELLGRPPPSDQESLHDGACPLESNAICSTHASRQDKESQKLHFPFVGPITLSDVGLPLFTILLGLLDGFNPCAMWVLLFLLSLLATLRDRRKMFLLAGAFVIISGIVYFAFMAAWLNIFLLIGFSRITQVVLGALAAVIGAINMKDFVAYRRGISLTIPEAVKPGLYAKVRCIIQAENLKAAFLGIIVLAVLVNLIELACTAGFPAMYTAILTLQQLGWLEFYGYLALYNLAYIADDSIMVAIAVVTLSHRKLQEQEGRWLKLIGGLVMLGLGITLILAPEWLF